MLLCCWWGDRKSIRPAKNWVLVCWCWQFDWSFARLIAPVDTTTIILRSNKIQNGDILVLANPGSPGKKWPLKPMTDIFNYIPIDWQTIYCVNMAIFWTVSAQQWRNSWWSTFGVCHNMSTLFTVVFSFPYCDYNLHLSQILIYQLWKFCPFAWHVQISFDFLKWRGCNNDWWMFYFLIYKKFHCMSQ